MGKEMMFRTFNFRGVRLREVKQKLAGWKARWLFVAILVLILATGASAAHAQVSDGYDLHRNSLGTIYAGGTLTSESYSLEFSTGNFVHISLSSEGYQLCSGYICQSSHYQYRTHLPTTQKATE